MKLDKIACIRKQRRPILLVEGKLCSRITQTNIWLFRNLNKFYDAEAT
jgi:hypothetical protein